MINRHANAEPLSDEQLVAYLDGEMDAVAARQLEARLADDDRLRLRLSELDRPWKLLDQLETGATGRDFTRTTLEMVVAAEQADRQRAAAPRQRLRQAVLVLVAMLGAGTAGFLAVAAVRPDPNRRLLEDLPVLENLEPYRAIDHFAFLAALYQAGLFSEDSSGETLPPEGQAPGEAALILSPEAARNRIQAMDRTEKAQLRRRQDQFAALEPAEQARLRRLYDDLAAAPNPQALQAVALRYHEWLKALPPITRAELVELAAEQRIDRIQSMLKRQAGERIRRLEPDEAQVFAAWLVERTEQMIEALPESVRGRIQQETNPQRRRAHLFMSLHTFRSSDSMRRTVERALDKADLAELIAKLPERTRLEMERRPLPEQWHIVWGWIPQLVRYRVGGRGARGLFPDAEEQTLMEFFENDLDDTELDRLLALPAEEMQRELQHLFWQRSKGGTSPGFRRPGPSRLGPRPGGHHSPEGGPPARRRSPESRS